MAKRTFLKGSVSNTVHVFIQDATTASGAGLVGVTTAINAAYCLGPVASSATTFSLASVATTGAWASGGWAELSSTKMIGLYRFDVPDAVFASTPFATVLLSSGSGGANMAPVVMELQVLNSSGDDNPVNVFKFGGTAVTGRDLGASVLMSSGTGTGQLVLTSGVVTADVTKFGGSAGTFASGRPETNMTHIAGSAVSSAAAQLGVNVVNFGGAAGTFASGRPEVNMTHLAGQAQTSRDIGASVLVSSGTGTGQIVLAAGVVGASMSASERNSIADALLDRNMATGADNSNDSTIRTVRQALRFLRNKWSISGTTLTVYKEDDSTSSHTAALTATAGANPITASDATG